MLTRVFRTNTGTYTKTYIPSIASDAVMPTNAQRSSTLIHEYARATRLKALFLVASKNTNTEQPQFYLMEIKLNKHFNENEINNKA